eukprot:gene1194-868_t
MFRVDLAGQSSINWKRTSPKRACRFLLQKALKFFRDFADWLPAQRRIFFGEYTDTAKKLNYAGKDDTIHVYYHVPSL